MGKSLDDWEEMMERAEDRKWEEMARQREADREAREAREAEERHARNSYWGQ